VNEWRKAQQLETPIGFMSSGAAKRWPLLMIQNPAQKLVGDAKEIKQGDAVPYLAEALVLGASASAKIQAASFRDCHGTVQPVAVPSYR